VGSPAYGHVPVMSARVTELLTPALSRPGSVLVDATLGRGGHARALLGACPQMTLIGIDADPAAIDAGAALAADFPGRVRLARAFYDDIDAVVTDQGYAAIQGALFDLGVSSPQLDDPDRGFAYAQDAPLDMRMDPSGELTAARVLNEYPVARLARVLREYGEEKFATRIAEAVARERTKEPLATTTRLAGIVKDAIPAPARRTGGNPAKRTFQALRIEVNDELGRLSRALPAALDLLDAGGRFAALAYHSLEDRLVKRALTARTADPTPRRLPVKEPTTEFRLLTRGAERPGADEISVNPRAASARLRAVERTSHSHDQPGGR
jgi:16S rRNA (cytosine1402-N4)-methyltransferase